MASPQGHDRKILKEFALNFVDPPSVFHAEYIVLVLGGAFSPPLIFGLVQQGYDALPPFIRKWRRALQQVCTQAAVLSDCLLFLGAAQQCCSAQPLLLPCNRRGRRSHNEGHFF